MNNATLASSAMVLLSLLSTSLHGGTSDHHDEHDHHQQQAHLHGRVEMTLAIDGNSVELNMESPAANIVGFEHAASTPQQRERVNSAKSILESPEKVLTFKGSHCELKAVEVDVSALLAPEAAGHSEDDDHKHEEDYGGHEDHGEHNHDDHAAGETHSEISAGYQFLCAEGTKLTAITVNLFSHFSGIETIHLAWVSDRNQAAAQLTADSTTIDLE
ncbi:MAG: DUF2796 domain-containing protein [Gammaproteobacteria bacterium]